jgi:transketolase
MNNNYQDNLDLINFLKEKSLWVRKETLNIHGLAPNTRLTSSLSPIEIFVTLYYGEILKFDPKNLNWKNRDRFVVSKGHGAVSLYPILADLNFFDKNELTKVSQPGSFLGDIPDSRIPGLENISGALGHGLGVACGIALALKREKSDSKVFVLMGDGELYEGAVWEAVMFAGHHRLDNLILIIDNNKISMLDFCKNIIDLEPLEEKFSVFKWKPIRVDGHNTAELYDSLKKIKENEINCPNVLIADTVKGKGIPKIESDGLCHIKSFKKEEIVEIIKNLR